MEGFEPYTSFVNLSEWEVINDLGNAWEITSTGLNSAQSARLRNYAQPVGTVDELISATRDLSSVTTNMTLSFRYAYKRRNTSDDDWLRVYASKDCGETWDIKKTLHGYQLTLGQAVQTQSSQFTPSSENDWTTVHMTNITSDYWVDNFRYKFNFEAGGGNNFYLDNINIYEGNPSDELIVGIEDMNDVYNGFNIYPNPAGSILNIQFDANDNQNINFEVVDITGKVAISTGVFAAAGNNLVVLDTEKLSSGLYFVKAKVGSAEKVMQFVKK